LLGAGLVLSLLAGLLLGSRTPVLLAALLVGAILAYDGWLKRTWAGPLGMGTCRFLNVLLGLSLAPQPEAARRIYLALIVGVYRVGVTWSARTAARASSRGALAGAALVMLAGLLLALPLPVLLADSPWHHDPSPLFVYLLVGFGFFLGLPLWRAIRE